MIAFAIGSLLGDSLFHLIPHAYGIHDHGGHDDEDSHHHHSHDEGDKLAPKLVATGVICGIMLFFFIEKVITFFGITHSHGDTDEKP